MQTFLPLEDFRQSARCLDRQRLGKQRVEAWQILNTLLHGGGWSHHPAVKMWNDHVSWLRRYGICICEEWISRGYKDTMRERFLKICLKSTKRPPWLGSKRFHSSHRAALLAKNIIWYSQFGWEEYPIIDYYWPRS